MPPQVICCGLSCVDMQLHECDVPQTLESIVRFGKTTFAAGGSAPQTARALAALSVQTSALTVIGTDPHGDTLRNLLISSGVDVSTLIRDASSGTALAVLPLFSDGTRGCFVTLGANVSATVDSLLSRSVVAEAFTSKLRVFHFGYPHLMPNLRGTNLRRLFEHVREVAPNALLTLDVNGADEQETPENPILLPALELVAAVHANLEEACTISGLASPTTAASLSAKDIEPIVRWFTNHGAEIACITCGKDGMFAATGGSETDPDNIEKQHLSPVLERGAFIYRSALDVTVATKVNASGAGDAFIGGVIAELVDTRGSRGIRRVADAGLVGALYCIDSSFAKANPSPTIASLLEKADGLSRIPPRAGLRPPGAD
ncbi:unnamed protein product [Chondrus crispus]|uniref:Carbohydrate kinase PfkB domain-containing protein n=1 Tax=Chondrus crispus TaxID=2769 RepID=S0F372_CHOCR|nr:unnamed protein product [Chondrus crispus]CDF77472.1 unnamed protein product [Chondrus crispus]|eukprot:XP_005712346.1 unnamed protein product [Chondrus crispus]